MAEVVTNYPNCTGCCSASCPNGYLRDIFGTSGICPDATIAAKPVLFLCEMTFDKAGSTWASPELAACFPDSLKFKLQSSGALIESSGGTCSTNMAICSNVEAGFNPAWPGVRIVKISSTGDHQASFVYAGMPSYLVSGTIIDISYMCNGTERFVTWGSQGMQRIVSHVCNPFEMIFRYAFNGDGWGTYVQARVKYTLATDCSSPYGLSGTVTQGLAPQPSAVPVITGKSFVPLATPVVSQATTPCKHLGANIQDPASCNCGTAILRHCSVYGACRVTGTSTAGEGICLTCPDYQSP